MIREQEAMGVQEEGPVSIIGLGGVERRFPAVREKSIASTPRAQAREVAGIRGDQQRVEEESCDDLAKRIRELSGEGSSDTLYSLEDRATKMVFIVQCGRRADALAIWQGNSGGPQGADGEPCVTCSRPEWSPDLPWMRSLSFSSFAESLAVAVVALSEKFLPGTNSLLSAGVRPWFSAKGKSRVAYVESEGQWFEILEGGTRAGGHFPLSSSSLGYFLAAESVEELSKLLASAGRGQSDRLIDSRGGAERIAILAPTEEKLEKRVKVALEKITDPSWRGSPRNGIFRGSAIEGNPKVAWLFDGQGSQHFQMMAELMIHFPRMRERLEEYEAVVEPGRNVLSILYPWENDDANPETVRYLNAMEGGASVAFVLNLALADLLQDCGVPCMAMAGHSNGENSALIAGGVLQMSDEDVLQCCRVLIAEAEYDQDVQGQALAVSLEDRESFENIMKESEGSVFLALDNCPHQVILFGGGSDIAGLRDRLEETGAVCTPLPFQRPFHTPWFEAGARSLAPFYEVAPVGKGHTKVFSCAHLKAFGDTRSDVVPMALSQFHMPVRFRELIERLDQEGADVFLEVGPGVSLKAFVDDTLGEGRSMALSSPRRTASVDSFLSAMGGLFVAGVDVDLSRFGFESAEGTPSDTEPVGIGNVGEVPAGNSVEMSEGSTGTVLEEHFSMMNEFLASQRRVIEACFGSAGAEATESTRGVEPEAAFDLPWPMLGEDVRVVNGHLEASRVFTIDSDPFLLDHTLGRRASRRRAGLYGLAVLPFTFSMELIAEAGLRLVGRGKVVTAIEEARGHRWLAVDQDELSLRIVAEILSEISDETVVRVTVYERLVEGEEKKAFEGNVRLASAYPAGPEPRFEAVEDLPPKRLNVPDFYRFGMFHGPRFQNIRRVKHLSETEVDADLQVFFLDDFFEEGESPAFQISPNLLDCAGQLTAYSMLEHVGGYYGLFPFRVGTLRLYAPPPASGVRVKARGSLHFDGSNTTMDFDYLDGSGNVLFRLESKQQRCFEFPKRYHMATFWPESGDGLGSPWLEDSGLLVERVEGISSEFLDQGWGVWKRALAHMILNQRERAAFYALPSVGPRRNEWLLGRAAAKAAVRRWARRELDLEIDSADVEICADSSGRPFAVCPEIKEVAPIPSLSIAHTGEIAVSAIDPEGAGLGIDLETVGRRELGDWLRQAFAEDELAFFPDASPEDLLPLWCAKEAAAKANGKGFQGVPEDWRIVSYCDGSAEVRHGENSYAVQVHREGDDIVATCRLPIPSLTTHEV